MRINYATYDNCQEEDIVNPRTRPDVMVLSAEAEESEDYHPYWYAQIIDLFHVRVRYVGPASQSSDPEWMELLYVRWFGREGERWMATAVSASHRLCPQERSSCVWVSGSVAGYPGSGSDSSICMAHHNTMKIGSITMWENTYNVVYLISF